MVDRVRRSHTSGFTLVEVILAISVLAIVLAAVSITVVSSIQHNLTSGSRSQAAQIMNYLGRRIAGGEISSFGTPWEWDYGELAGAFSDLSRERNLADPDLYRARVALFPSIGLGDSAVPHYRVTVCWDGANGESCVSGDTAGAEPGGTSGEILPGIN